jgi:hypothetical protein
VVRASQRGRPCRSPAWGNNDVGRGDPVENIIWDMDAVGGQSGEVLDAVHAGVQGVADAYKRVRVGQHCKAQPMT